MDNEESIFHLSKNFKDEEKDLKASGRTTWLAAKSLKDQEIDLLVRKGRSTYRNLKKIRGIAEIVCELGLPPEDAALLIHSGLSSIESVARATPQQVVLQTGRLIRQLNSNPRSLVDLAKAKLWIQKAKARQIVN